MYHPLPIKAASPRSISITSTTGWVLLPSQTQHKGDRFKIPAPPDPLISSSTHWFSTCTTEGTLLPPSIPTRRAPGSGQHPSPCLGPLPEFPSKTEELENTRGAGNFLHCSSHLLT